MGEPERAERPERANDGPPLDANRQLKGVRLRHDIIRRVNLARRDMGLTFQGFVQRAVGEAVEAWEQKKAISRIARQGPTTERRSPVGLGIRERLVEEEPVPVERVPAPSQQTVTVQVQAHAATSTPDLAPIAQMIASSPPAQRRRLLENACLSLAQGRTREEGLRLGELLDNEIKRAKSATALDRVRARRTR